MARRNTETSGGGGEPADPPGLAAHLYRELRDLAARRFQAPLGIHKTLQPTLLVNEAYLRLRGSRELEVKDRAHFFCLAAQAMRQVVIDHAGSKQTDKRGGDWRRVSLADVFEASGSPEVEVLDLERARRLRADGEGDGERDREEGTS